MKKKGIIGIGLILFGIYACTYCVTVEEKEWYDYGNLVVSIMSVYYGAMLGVMGKIL